MRINLIAFLIGLTFFNVSASVVRAQTISISVKDATVEQVFKAIEKQTAYRFWYEKKDLEKEPAVTLNLKNETLEVALERLFENHALTYKILDNTIVVKPKQKTAIERITNYFKSITVTGKVTDEKGLPLAGANVNLKGTNKTTITDKDGNYKIEVPDQGAILVFTFIGYLSFEQAVNNTTHINISLKEDQTSLQEINIVKTGYQTLTKEKATGSFTLVNNALLNRTVTTNILDRLDGITSGLIFNNTNDNSGIPRGSIEIRGRTTLFSNAEPLIVVDNFPYEGNLSNINPNDVESITVLKDASSASVWGSRSGNGVIVITTKKGALNTAPKVSINANITIGDKPDLYYRPQLSSAQFIEVEQFLYNKGAYTSTINNGYSALSPAVEIFNARKNGLSVADSTAQINALKSYDVREQQLKYLYRPSVNQQYQASISGGGNAQTYFVSAGYDKNLLNDVTANFERFTLNANNTYNLYKDKLELNTNLVYTSTKTAVGQSGINLQYPYSRLADDNGNALTVANVLRPSYAGTAGGGKLLNWLYKPLDELNNRYNTYSTNLTDYRLNLSLTYKIIKGLNAVAYYSFEKGINENTRLNELQSFYTRNLINQFTQINNITGAVTYPLPVGSMLSTGSATVKSNSGRFQINYEHTWNKHALNTLIGTEVRDNTAFTTNSTLYGYNDDTKTNQNDAVNTTVDYPYFYNSNSSKLGLSPTQLGTTNRFVSIYFNGFYTYNGRYIASFSARKDESNLFGVATNQKGVPLWSAGLAWLLNKEAFYNLNWLPQLKLRASYGYTGNVNNNISALLTAFSDGLQKYNANNAHIVNPPNPLLRWEKTRNINLGLDFSSKGNRLSGSVDWWNKKGIDLIGNSPIAPQTGIALYTGNSANALTKGLDIELNSINMNGAFKWYTTLLYTHTSSKVTDYKVNTGTNNNVVSGNYNNPLVGYPYYALFSYKYAGLNNLGNPQGYLNGTVSTDYTAIRSSTNRADLVYNGSAVPTSFGSLRNTITYKNFDLSINILYKFGYYFRRTSLDNGVLYGGGPNYQMADYDKRWQKPGDELLTNVPALIFPNDFARTSLYTYSDVLVEKGDHIRLRDLRLGYTLPNSKHLPFRNLNVFTYINNLGIIWRANKQNIDPDYVTGIPNPRTYAIGLKTDL